MPELKERKEITEEYFLGAIYKNVKMGADAIIHLLPSVKDDSMRSVMTIQLDGYEKYAARAATALEERGQKAKEENILTRFSAKMGIAFHTMLDASVSHIAEMMIQGSNMAMTDMIKLLNTHVSDGSAPDATRLAREVVAFEEHNLEILKRYL